MVKPLRNSVLLIVSACITACAGPAQGPSEVQIDSANYERGRLLYENHCQVCHDSRAHIRSNRKAHSHAQVSQWVTRWAAHLQLDWQEREIEDVSTYLVTRYYKFGPTRY